MSRTLQFRRLGATTLANTTGANGELIINTTNKTLTVHDGVTPGGFALLNQSTDFDIDQYARNTANSATNLAQSAYNFANTLTVSTVDQFARNTANSKFSSSGGQITGSVIIVGDLDVTDNTVVTNAIEANNVIIDGSLKTGLAARASVVLPHLIAQFASNSASYVQVNQQNINAEGSADWVATADNGTDTDFYIDLGLHNSQAFDKVLTPYDGYLFVQGSTIGQAGGNLVIGTTSNYPGLETMFVAGGYEANNVVMKLGTGGANVVGDLIVTGQIIGPTINAISGGGVTGNISIAATNSAINFVANSSGDGVGFSTIQLVPDTNSFSDQYVIIDPTAPSHIHIRAGGVQDSSGAQLFLGGEKQYVRVTDNQGIRLQNEETNDNYYYYSNTVQYIDGTWYEEGGNYFIQFTTNDSQMVTDLSNFASGGSPNQVILYWNNGVEIISNTMISPTSFWQGIGNVYTAQVSETLPANNTTLTAIEFHLFTTQTNYVGLENNDFTVDVNDDIRMYARDVFSLRNYAVDEPISIITDYNANAWTWSFDVDGELRVPGAVNFQQNLTIPLGPPVVNGTNDRVRLWDFEGGGTGYNYAIGAEGNHIWFSMDVNNGTGGFKFYSRDNQVFKIRDDGALIFSDTSVQDSASISIVALKALVANCATYGDFQTAIAAL